MITLIVGHRGTGKSAFLKRIETYLEELNLSGQCIDLDSWTEKQAGKSISDIFTQDGEAHWRSLESKALHELYNTHKDDAHCFIAVGAGYEGPIPGNVEVLWLRRPSDASGRIFSDRPVLEPGLAPLDEYHKRFQEREDRFHDWSDRMFMLPEGAIKNNDLEKNYIFSQLQNVSGCLTVLPQHFKNPAYIMQRLAWGNFYFELRDDLLSQEQVKQLCELIPIERLLYSIRQEKILPAFIRDHNVLWDWPLELGDCPHGTPPILSCHDKDALNKLTASNSLLKAAPIVNDFKELQAGHAWWQENPAHRIFLPRSNDGRWKWYRLLMKPHYKINFWREDDGSAVDQPWLLEWLRTADSFTNFAAILGDPVAHSWTPIEQEAYFKKYNMPVFAIRMNQQEWKEGAFDFLQSLGLTHGIITSPLKYLAHQISQHDLDDHYSASNTLMWDGLGKAWYGYNSDASGFKAMLGDIQKDDHIALWGGGGTLEIMQDALPQAIAYSTRSGQPRDGNALDKCDVLVWAVGRTRLKHSPPAHWKPRVVIDLHYSQDSPGLEYALQCGAHYVSGAIMFKAQAKQQRKFWDECHASQ